VQKRKIDILLHEYDFLCNQLNTRINIYYALVAGMSLLFVTVVIPVMGASGQTLAYWIGVIAALIVICAVLSWLLHKDSQKLTDRLRNLEADINRRAGGECLLKWETQLSGSAQGYLRHYLPSLFGREKGHHRDSL
jgi:hypothetical protein